MDEEILQRTGLSPGESKVYLALLNLGQSTTGPIVEKSGVSTSKTYKILKRLQNKGLVSHVVRNNVVHWSPANPRRILELIEYEGKRLHEQKAEIEKILPDLLNRIEKLKEKQQAEIYVGLKGMITVYNDETDYLMKYPDVTECVIGIASIYQKRYRDFFRRLDTKRDKLGIKRKMLLGVKAKGAYPYAEKSEFVEMRYLNFPDSPVSINIYGDTSLINVLAEESIFIVISSREIAKSFVDYFNLLWKIAKK